MKTIKEGIVFSNDIQNILSGYNAITFNYIKNGMSIPNQQFISSLRDDFNTTVNQIFNNKVTIITEEEMTKSIGFAITDVLWRYPHSIIRSNIFINR